MKDSGEVTIEQLRRVIQEVGGGFTDQEGKCLYQLAKGRHGEGVIVEIGSWKGKSTIWLAKGSEAGGRIKVYAIDPHQGTVTHSQHGETDTEPIFRRNIKRAGVEHIVTPIVMKSEEAIRGWAQPISLLWIDGLHEYEDVRKDFLLYEPYLESGGIVAFHDCFFSGPRRLIRQYILRSNLFSNVGITGSIVFATKKQSTVRDKGIKFRLLLLSYAAGLVDFLAKPGWLSPIRRFLGKLGRVVTKMASRR